jgi:hypothetical protein
MLLPSDLREMTNPTVLPTTMAESELIQTKLAIEEVSYGTEDQSHIEVSLTKTRSSLQTDLSAMIFWGSFTFHSLVR